MLYLLDFHLGYSVRMSQEDLFSIWPHDGDAAMVGLWKCVGTRRVVAVINVDGPDMLDRIMLDLPIMKKHDQHVHVKVTPLRPYEDFAADVKKRLDRKS